MRALILDRGVGTRTPPPPNHMPALWQQFRDWRDRWRSKMEVFEFFADGNGGFAVADVADERELQQMVIEYPFTGFDELEVHVVVDGDDSLDQWQPAVEQMATALV